MTTLYVTSTETFSGKSALCLSLVLRFREDGVKVSYMKPVNTMASCRGGQPYDEDVAFIKSVLGLTEPMETLAPVALTQTAVEAILKGEDTTDYAAKLRAAFDQICPDCDVAVLEGGQTLREGYIVGLPTPQVAAMLKSKVITIVRWHDALVADHLLAARTRLGDAMIGGVINFVPRGRMELAEKVVKPFMERHDVPILAILPQDDLLRAATIGELAEGLEAEVICGEEYLDRLVEQLMVGAMSPDAALGFFRRQANKAVITGGDRSDIQLVALETPTACLILTGNILPTGAVIARAEALNVPILVTKHDTFTAVEIADRYFGHSRFWRPEKIARFQAALAKRFDFDFLYKALDLEARAK
jgi:BioD-like phosphotransacetylase family protein